VPWYSYPAILWLDGRLPATARVFEYGAGNSTRWFAARSAVVAAVDHDRAWVDRISPTLPSNASVSWRAWSPTDLDAYVTSIDDFDPPYDVVVVDGVARTAALRLALERVRPDGIVILDNADRPSLAGGLAHASETGFLRIDFSGPVPGSGRFGTTTILGRDLTRWLRPAPELPLLGYERDDAS
jgi:hypothetical protein